MMARAVPEVERFFATGIAPPDRGASRPLTDAPFMVNYIMFTRGGVALGSKRTGWVVLNKTTFALGLAGLAAGTFPFLALMGVLPTAPHTPDAAPGWVGAVIGLAFLLAGITAIIRSFAGSDASGNLLATAPRTIRILNDGLGILIVVSLAALFSWVAFGSGERHFTVSLDGFVVPAGAGGDMAGRVMFGLGAVLAWCMAGAMVLLVLRRRRR
jgi:hypothetical protein